MILKLKNRKKTRYIPYKTVKIRELHVLQIWNVFEIFGPFLFSHTEDGEANTVDAWKMFPPSLHDANSNANSITDWAANFIWA